MGKEGRNINNNTDLRNKPTENVCFTETKGFLQTAARIREPNTALLFGLQEPNNLEPSPAAPWLDTGSKLELGSVLGLEPRYSDMDGGHPNWRELLEQRPTPTDFFFFFKKQLCLGNTLWYSTLSYNTGIPKRPTLSLKFPA